MASVPVYSASAQEAAPVDPRVWREDLLRDINAGARPLTLYGRPDEGPVLLTAVLEDAPGHLGVHRTRVDPAEGYHSLTGALPTLHCFERELHEQHGVRIAGHPWMKPVRFEGAGGQIAMNGYPFYVVEGKDVHEVAVGPIHAGVIEPGSFRFMCHGERVLHLEVHLGYQHRGVERLLLASDPRRLAPLVETIAGDTSIGHTWAYAAAIERLAAQDASEATERSRGLLLELERIAMHLATLGGMAADIGFLQGGTTYGRLRTTVINTTMRLCGSRFGRGGVRPGGPAFALDAAAREMVKGALDLLEADLPTIDDRFLTDRTVQHRLQEVGVVPKALATQIGLVGLAGRASGIAVDQRVGAGGIYQACPVEPQGETTGDCWARARLRIHEMRASLRWIRTLLDAGPEWRRERRSLAPLAPSQLVVAAVEGWRGEIVHSLETDAHGELRQYKVQDPSFRNWLGLALAVRGNEISDFPICNKSFDLSYCGHDL
jgi:Ni,Fe-hydrogenase III large subunit